MNEKIQKSGVYGTEWRHMYFAGISKQPINQINLTEGQVSGLLSMIKLNAVISSGTAIEPQYPIKDDARTSRALCER